MAFTLEEVSYKGDRQLAELASDGDNENHPSEDMRLLRPALHPPLHHPGSSLGRPQTSWGRAIRPRWGGLICGSGETGGLTDAVP